MLKYTGSWPRVQSLSRFVTGFTGIWWWPWADATLTPALLQNLEQLSSIAAEVPPSFKIFIGKQTHAISDFLEQQLHNNLSTLQSLFLFERLFGKMVGSRFDVPGADKALSELLVNYRKLPGKPFDFPQEFENDWLMDVGARLDLHRWKT